MESKKLVTNFFEYEGPREYKDIFKDDKNINEFELFLKKHKIDDSFKFDRTGLKASHYVGSIRFKGQTINVYPKLLDSKDNSTNLDDESIKTMLRNLLTMLSYTHKLQIKENEISSFDFSKNCLLDVFIYLFAKDLYKCLEKELPFLYKKTESNLSYVKGKIKFNENIKKNSTNPSKIYCQYQSFETNNILSQTFKYICNKLLPLSKNNETKNYLSRILKQLNTVENKSISYNEIQTYIIPRSIKNLERPFNFCKMILSNKSFSLSEGNSLNYCIIFNMNEVFEEYIAEFLERNKDLLNIKKVYPQNEKYLFQGNTAIIDDSAIYSRKNSRKTFQDIMIEFNNGHRLIIDTKYKIINKTSEVSSNDIYQVMAYHHIEKKLDSKIDILLLYPKHINDVLNIFKTSGEISFNVNISTINLNDLTTITMQENFKKIFQKTSNIEQIKLVS